MFVCSFVINSSNILVFQISSCSRKQEASCGKTLEIHSIQSRLRGSGSRFVFRKLSDYCSSLIRSSFLSENYMEKRAVLLSEVLINNSNDRCLFTVTCNIGVKNGITF